jgi:hypothetical protein
MALVCGCLQVIGFEDARPGWTGAKSPRTILEQHHAAC